MRHALLVMALAAAIAAAARDWGLSWIACTAAGGQGQALFRRTFTLAERPVSARITVASGGLYELYVNGYNVTTDVLEPLPASPCGAVAVTDYEVGRFLRAGDNVVAVWYSPLAPCRKQLALSLCARYPGGGGFAMNADSTWMCRPAGAESTPGGAETIDGNAFSPCWNRAGEPVMGWDFASQTDTLQPSRLVHKGHLRRAMRIGRISRHTFLDDDGRNVAYRFASPFCGWVRVTLRGMHRGDTLCVNGLTYICTGEADEQACRRFTTSLSDIAVISGPDGFSRENIMSVEAIDIWEYLRTSYMY